MGRSCQSSHPIVVLAIVGAVLVGLGEVGCSTTEFLRGVACRDSSDCGSLECAQGFCGGCPEGLVDDMEGCLCRGERIFDCQRIDAPYCVSVCESVWELCHVVAVLPDGRSRDVPSCEAWFEGFFEQFDEEFDEEFDGECDTFSDIEPSGDLCFGIRSEPPTCSEGMAGFEVGQIFEVAGGVCIGLLDDPPSLVVNCPPAASEEFECPLERPR
ncbi:MAG: hypothetical protein AAGF11_09840 [Myxococcota bacterium]